MNASCFFRYSSESQDEQPKVNYEIEHVLFGNAEHSQLVYNFPGSTNLRRLLLH